MKTPALLLLAFLIGLVPSLRAQLRLPAIIGDHMVLQQKQANPIWGWDTPGARVTVAFAGQTHTATAGGDGRWSVRLSELPASAQPQTLTIAGTSRREVREVLIGEVWMCSGQSNMAWTLAQSYDGDLEALAANLPQVRLITVPPVGTQELQTDFKGGWAPATSATVRDFSAVGYRFGRTLHRVLGVPVGLIDNAWGGSSAEAWIRRATLDRDPRFALLREATAQREAALLSTEGRAEHDRAVAAWQTAVAQAKAERKPLPRAPANWLTGQHRPGNIFAGVVHPTLGYGIKGVIWYQGENNASRAYEYRSIFPFLIEQWRKEWGQGDFPFYWVQLANFRATKPAPEESAWAELRDSQTQALALGQTGQAVIIDLGEGRDIHPRNKHDVAARLVRWALARDYGFALPYRSPEFRSLAIAGNKATVTLDCFGSSLRSFDVVEVTGLAICGPDRKWHWAQGRVVGPDRVEVWSDHVPAPIAVRYAWADNPVCNLYSEDGLPVTPFRTDNFEMTTKP